MKYARLLFVLVVACGGATSEQSASTTLPTEQPVAVQNGWPSQAKLTWSVFSEAPICPETTPQAYNGARVCAGELGAVFCVPAEAEGTDDRCYAVANDSEAHFGIQTFARIEGERVWFVQTMSYGGPGWDVTERSLLVAEASADGLGIVAAMPLGRTTRNDESGVREELRYSVSWADQCAVVEEAAHTCNPADAEGCPRQMRAAPSILNGDVPSYEGSVTDPFTNFAGRWGLREDGTWGAGGC